jgi:hypothetical protein
VALSRIFEISLFYIGILEMNVDSDPAIKMCETLGCINKERKDLGA